MRLLIAAAVLLLGIACGDGETTDPPPTPTPDERVEYWAEVLAQRQFAATNESSSFELCYFIGHPERGAIGLGDDAAILDQIPREIGEAVSIRMMEKLQEKCAAAQSSSPSN